MGGKREGAGRKSSTKYKPEYCEFIIERMAEGALDAHLQAALDISTKTFHQWLQKYPAFQDAYERGKPKKMAWWLEAGKEKYPPNYWTTIMTNEFNYAKNAAEAVAAKVSNTQINIGAINVMKDKSSDELRQIIKDKLNFIELLPQEKNNNDPESLRSLTEEPLRTCTDGGDSDGISGS